jgi:hypothetical protein
MSAPKTAKKKNGANSTGFPEKLYNKLPTGFVESAEGKSSEELKAIILKSQGIVADLEKDMSDDDKLKALKDELADLRGGYTDTLDAEKAKTRYALHLLRLRGDR